MLNSITLSQDLIRSPSVSPADSNAIDILITPLEKMNFTCHKLVFGDVTNLFAIRYGKHPHITFAGHIDVVPPGLGWKYEPFSASINEGYIYGRGAVDMKSAIAAFVVAISKTTFDGTISLLISGNEEDNPTNGTPKILEWLKKHNIKIDYCIVGEPTNPFILGEMIKIGRRGSISFDLKVNGIQGHVAYPDLALNPINNIIKILMELKSINLDNGNDNFPASNLEITTVDVGNAATNVIPNSVSAKFNIRFNNLQNFESLINIVENICNKYSDNFDLQIHKNSESFLLKRGKLVNIASNAIENITKIKPVLSTTGGTSDARFIKDYVDELIEFGLINLTAHKINERVKIDDIENLTSIYKKILDQIGEI